MFSSIDLLRCVYSAATALCHLSLAVLIAAQPARGATAEFMPSTGVGVWRLTTTHWEMSMKAMKTTHRQRPVRNLVTSPTFTGAPDDRISELACRGKSAIKRAAIVPFSRCADGLSGSAAIDAANLWVAVSRGSPASSAASCQGSISNRASAESMLSGVSFLSLPIGANKKSSNCVPRTEAKAERVISFTELHRLLCFHELHSGLVR